MRLSTVIMIDCIAATRRRTSQPVRACVHGTPLQEEGHIGRSRWRRARCSYAPSRRRHSRVGLDAPILELETAGTLVKNNALAC
jgi:hypothetical protein